MKLPWHRTTKKDAPSHPRISLELVPMGARLKMPEGSDTSRLQEAYARQAVLDRLSQSMFDYILGRLAVGESVTYPNDIAGWTLENLELIRSEEMHSLPEVSAFIDGEFTRMWWLVKSCL